MPRIFVFGIGGTGSRVIKSLILLMAAGVKTNGYDIVPILIDPHKDLNELKNCKKILEQYSILHKEIYTDFTPANDAGFFHSKLISLGALGTDGLKDDFDFDSKIDETFGDFLNINHLKKEDPNKDLINLLYSDQSLKKSLSVGFKGNPNIGSVVLNQFDNASWYKAFGSVFSQGDKIFIISSIFGGTGASGFPLLLKNLRGHDNKYIKDAEIGALPVMPYFKLADPDGNNPHQEIDSNNFFTKTKAALSYYSKNLKDVNALYYIGDPDAQSNPYENDEEKQNNKAHLIELIGASSILHFAKNTNTGKQYFSFGLEKDNSVLNFKTVGDPLKKEIMVELIDYYIFSKIHPEIIKESKLPFRITSGFDDSFYKSDFFLKLKDFNDNYFLPWLKELNDNERSFSPFNLKIGENKFHSLVKEFEIELKGFGIFSNKYETANFTCKMGKIEKQFKRISNTKKNAKYMSMCQTAINAVNNEILKLN